MNVAKMSKLEIVQVTYFVESGTDQSSFWRGNLVTVFDVKRDARGYLSFGDDVSLGTCEGKVTLCTRPYRPGENYRYPSRTSTSGDKPTNGSQTGGPQSANDNGAPTGHDETSSEIGTEPHQPPGGPSPARPSDSDLNVKAFGISSTDLLLPYVTNTTADGGSHFWIYSVARNGDCCRALLFVQDPSSEKVVYDAYYVAYRNGKEDRISLTNEDAEREIGFIEQVLVASGVKALYDSCYAEGCLRSDQQDEAEDR